MIKRLFSALLCMLLLVSVVIPVGAVEEEQEIIVEIKKLSISTTEEFLKFAENCRLDSFSQNLEVTLEDDIDLSDSAFTGVPVFCGIFQGKGHTISGIHINADGSYQGLFRYLTTDAVVKDLAIEGTYDPKGSRNYVGTIAGSNAGTILHCEFRGSVSGGDYVGGIAGTNTITGVIENCLVEGNIHGDHFVGGIAGENSGVIRNCTNCAAINTTPQQNEVEISDIHLENLMNTEAANTATDIGGIAGISSGVIRDSENRGDVGYQQIGYNIGGIAGTQSGYLVKCKNYGGVQGRKEIGGIVGQMEPVAQIEFSEDTLQILQEQLNTMSGLVNRASANAQNSGSQISKQIAVLQDQAKTAKDAVDTMLPDREDPDLPDPDTILAAQNTLSNTMNAMPRTLEGIASAAQATVSGITRDLNAVSNQMGAMGQTLQNGAENLGGSITDISDQDTPELLTGKVESCVNYGSVLADLNAGGITGAMAVENDLDVTEDWEQSGESSLNFQSEVRAVILNCENSGVITGKKQNVGGLVGWQSLGLVKSCTNTGKVDGAAAQYVGGTVGRSTGYLRTVSANCEIAGASYVGGIAGSAMIVTDSLSQVKISDGHERLGAVLGWAEENQTEEEAPIRGNFYLPVDADLGAIDGISYHGLAQPLDLDAFLATQDLPDTFRKVRICFWFEDGTMKEVSIPIGGDLIAEQIPEIPVKEGYSASWRGLDQAQLTDILFDMNFDAVYGSHGTTIESPEVRLDGRPVLLLEGSFTAAASVTAEKSDEIPQLTENQKHLESWTICASEPGVAARFLPDEVEDTESLLLFVRNEDGQWQQANFHVAGSYLVFELTDSQVQIALVQQVQRNMVWVIAAGGILAVLLAVIVIILKKKRSKAKDSCAE